MASLCKHFMVVAGGPHQRPANFFLTRIEAAYLIALYFAEGDVEGLSAAWPRADQPDINNQNRRKPMASFS
jgi:hypothetical protein